MLKCVCFPKKTCLVSFLRLSARARTERYALYAEYGFEHEQIASLFVAGFGSSMLFGTFAGSLADTIGRKRGALLYVAFYVASCVTKHWKSYGVLMLGRVLGGIATSLLFCVFDSWLVTEHAARGFEASWLSSVFANAQAGNSIVAIASGVLGERAAHHAYTIEPHIRRVVFEVRSLSGRRSLSRVCTLWSVCVRVGIAGRRRALECVGTMVSFQQIGCWKRTGIPRRWIPKSWGAGEWVASLAPLQQLSKGGGSIMWGLTHTHTSSLYRRALAFQREWGFRTLVEKETTLLPLFFGTREQTAQQRPPP